jgi:hypothetical protein
MSSMYDERVNNPGVGVDGVGVDGVDRPFLSPSYTLTLRPGMYIFRLIYVRTRSEAI